MSIIVSNCQDCDEQQFQTLSCVHYTIFSVVKLNLFIRALLLDRILSLGKTTRTPRVHLVFLYSEQLHFNDISGKALASEMILNFFLWTKISSPYL